MASEAAAPACADNITLSEPEMSDRERKEKRPLLISFSWWTGPCESLSAKQADQALPNPLLIQWFLEAEFFQVHNLLQIWGGEAAPSI